MIDGIPIGGLQVGVPITIASRDETLSGEFGDGTTFSIALNSANVGTGDFVSPTATLTVTLVDPASGDFDFDADIDGADFLAWQRGTSPNPLSAGDLVSWQASYSASEAATAHSIPEPTASALALLAVVMHVRSSHRQHFS